MIILMFGPSLFQALRAQNFLVETSSSKSIMVEDCTKAIVTFSFANTSPFPQVPVTLTVDFFLLRDINAPFDDAITVTSLNPSHPATRIGHTSFGTLKVTQWQFTVTLPTKQQGFLDVSFCLFRGMGEFEENENIIRYRITEGAFTTPLIPEPLLIAPGSPHPITSIGNGGSFTLTSVATGLPGGMDLPPGNTTQQILIDGTLLIDQDYTFAGLSNIYMKPGASIEVISGPSGPSTFQLIDMTKVEGCNGLWNGIVATDGTTLTIDGGTDTSTPGMVQIKDADRAVVIRTTATVNVNETRFVDNVVGVSAPFLYGASNFSAISISNSIFESSGFGSMPWAGVEANDLFNVLTLKDNVYNDMFYGVIGSNSSMLSMGETFTNILVQGFKVSGNGKHKLTQTGLGPFIPSFDNCGTGIHVRGMHLECSDNLMKKVTTGVGIERGVLVDADIETNTINADYIGIGIEEWRSLRTEVNDNDITIRGTGTDGVGIFVNGTLNILGQFSDNDIDMLAGRTGIWLGDCTRARANDNSIDISSGGTGVLEGIRVDGGHLNALTCNNIDGLGKSGDQAGIFYNMTNHATLNCNTTDDTGIGIHATFTNTSTLQGNLLNDHGNGIQVGEPNNVGGEIGDQFHGGNLWAGTYDNVGAAHYGSQTELSFSNILHNPNDVPPFGSQFFSTDQPSGQVFEPNFNGNAFVCTGSLAQCPPDPLNFMNNITDRDRALVTDKIIPNYYATEQDWTAKRHLYQRLLLDPSLIVPGSEIDSFYNANAATTIGQFEQLRKGVNDLFETDSVTYSLFDTHFDQIDAQTDSLASIVEQLDNDPTPQEETSLLAQRQVVQGQIGSLVNAIAPAVDSLDIVRKTTAAQLLTTNNAISDTAIYETNQKQYNQIWLQMLINGQHEPDSSQTVTLENIAGQCPYSGGEAVYQARALLGTANTYDDKTICWPPAPIQRRFSDSDELEFSVFPNPAHGYLVVRLNRELEEGAQVVVTNPLGQTLLSQKLKPGEREFFVILTEIPSGTYFVTVNTKSKASTKPFTNLK